MGIYKGENYYQYLLRFNNLLFATQKLLKKSKNVVAKEEVCSLLHEITQSGLEKLFYTILDRYPTLSIKDCRNKKDKERSLVHTAVEANSPVILQKLIKHGADPAHDIIYAGLIFFK